MNEEIKALKKYISRTKISIYAMFKIETISNLIIYYENLQQRMDKATEFVEDYQNQFQGEEVEYDMKQLLKILRGEDNE